MGKMRCLGHQACPLTEALEMKSDRSDGELRMQLRRPWISSLAPRGGGYGHRRGVRTQHDNKASQDLQELNLQNVYLSLEVQNSLGLV